MAGRAGHDVVPLRFSVIPGLTVSFIPGLTGNLQCVDDRLRDALVGEKMLAEGLLGAYFHIKSVIPAKILIFFC